MKWVKIVPGDNLLLNARIGDYLYYADESNPQGVEALYNLYSIAYVDNVAVNVFNMCDGKQMVRTRGYYECGYWFYLPLPHAFR